MLIARSLVHARAKSEKMDIKYGGVSSDFSRTLEPLRSLSCDQEMALKGGLQCQVCLAMVGQARVPYSLYRTES